MKNVFSKLTINRNESITILLCFAFSALCVPWHHLEQISDFIRYYVVSVMMQHGAFAQIYDLNQTQILEKIILPHSLHGYTYFLLPPILCWIFFPLAWFNFKIALYSWTILSLLSVIAFCLLLCNFCNIKGLKKTWVMAAIANSGPLLEAVRLAQLSSFFLCALITILIGLKKNRPFLTSIAQSVFWLKPHYMVPILLFELAAGYTGCFTLTLLIAIFGSVIYINFAGPGILSDYVAVIKLESVEKSHLSFIFQPTMQGQLLKLSVNFSLTQQLELILFALVLFISLILGVLVKKGRLSQNVLFTVIVPLSLCFSLQSHNYDLLMLVPGLVLLLSYSLTTFSNSLKIFLICLNTIVFLSLPYIYLHYFYVLRNGIINPFFWTVLIFAIGNLYIELQNNINVSPEA